MSYFEGGDGASSSVPAGMPALAALVDASVHCYVVPLFAGVEPVPEFYSWLKVIAVDAALGLTYRRASPVSTKGFLYRHGLVMERMIPNGTSTT